MKGLKHSPATSWGWDTMGEEKGNAGGGGGEHRYLASPGLFFQA